MMRHLQMLLVGSAIALMTAGCGTITTSPDATTVTVGSAVRSDYPGDGWYAYLLVPMQPTRNEDEKLGEQLVALAEEAGFSAALYPHPGAPTSCRGGPCMGDGPAPGQFLAVVLEPVDGPDFSSPFTSTDELTTFYDTTSRTVMGTVDEKLAASAAATGFTAALPASDVHWLSFSVFKAVDPWQPPDDLSVGGGE